MECKTAPQWLFQLLKAEFNTSRTTDRINNNYCFFCTTCMGNSIREVDKPDHPDHEILQVVKASHNFAVRVSSMTGKLDYNEIAQFSVNSKSIFFLNSRANSKEKCENRNSKAKQPKRACVVCEWRLPEGDTTSLYCSLGCKFKSANVSFRKRSRKGIPIRSMLS